MKRYTYKGNSAFYYHDTYIANFGDLLEINGNEIRNLTKNAYAIHKVTEDIVKEIIEHSVEESNVDIDDEDEYVDTLMQSTFFYRTNRETIEKLITLGILKTDDTDCQDYNIGKSNYSEHVIQPWNIWQEYNLNAWDADIIKRILRTKKEENMTKKESRIMDYRKIIHICKERIRQLNI